MHGGQHDISGESIHHLGHASQNSQICAGASVRDVTNVIGPNERVHIA